MLRTTVIIPQYGQPELTINAVRTLLQHHTQAVECLIVDDGSPAPCRRQLQQTLPAEVMLLPSQRRGGVTAAWNAGARSSTSELLVFLNNDTLTTGCWIPRLTAPLSEASVELVGCEERMEKDFPDVAGGAGSSLILAGWCFALRRDTLLELGGFDERLRLYYSDTDLQARLWRKSLQASQRPASPPWRWVGNLPVTHLGHRSTRCLKSRSREWQADRQLFLRKWRS
ncbi:glycosyltransferase family 2 protein [Planctomicrobium sp. SH664]|uniref:glycosyltransferase family 2 protein n=1 Tax=Planctomicrobium sp. SH664 TaxID=3448125 RepID=UPI003F5C4DAD